MEREDVEAFFADVERRQPRAHDVRSAGLAVSRQSKREPDEGASTRNPAAQARRTPPA